jgi:hypothetical protein
VTTMTSTKSIACGNCQGTHASVAEVKACYTASGAFTEAPAPATTVPTGPVQTSLYDHGAYPWTTKQRSFLQALIAERPTWAARENLADLPFDQFDGVTKRDASRYIKAALAQPKETKTSHAPSTQAPAPKVPQGYYAVDSATGNNDTDFYKVDTPTEGRWAGRTFVKRVIGGKGDTPVRGAEGLAALARIEAAGVKAAAERYGREIGRCGKCNRTLTDEESRAAGIGPVCREGW